NSANKTEIKKAIEALFNVKVNSIRVCNMKGKTKRFGRTLGRQQDWKKAYVTLAAGSEIDLHENA
ncbi:MAG: 50S ribosomal protein L23, partial [Gammaproteobacteria bacterium RIFOXYB2_FULL_38_6]